MEEENKDFCIEENSINIKDDSLHTLATMTAASFMKEVFPKFWNDAKDQVKDLSRKDLAEEMFHAGAINILYGYMKLMDTIAKKEEK